MLAFTQLTTDASFGVLHEEVRFACMRQVFALQSPRGTVLGSCFAQYAFIFAIAVLGVI